MIDHPLFNVDMLMKLWRDTKQQHDELRPMVVMLVDNQVEVFIVEDRDGIPVVGEVVRERTASPIQAAAFQADTYTLTTAPSTDKEEALRRYPRGSLEALFLAGDPRVGEALVLTLMDADGHTDYVEQRYRMMGGLLVWGEVVRSDNVEGDLDGAVIDHLRALLGVAS